ncbi:MAG: hypothetical protein JOS17DRAFT_460975 [Linnemannia elongata]|nr:MAG: hypothetical protein JOS17DRAFT_460975 [Linnemannia elongata]
MLRICTYFCGQSSNCKRGLGSSTCQQMGVFSSNLPFPPVVYLALDLPWTMGWDMGGDVGLGFFSLSLPCRLRALAFFRLSVLVPVFVHLSFYAFGAVYTDGVLNVRCCIFFECRSMRCLCCRWCLVVVCFFLRAHLDFIFLCTKMSMAEQKKGSLTSVPTPIHPRGPPPLLSYFASLSNGYLSKESSKREKSELQGKWQLVRHRSGVVKEDEEYKQRSCQVCCRCVSASIPRGELIEKKERGDKQAANLCSPLACSLTLWRLFCSLGQP